MKNTVLFIFFFVILLVSCEPIEDRENLPRLESPEEVAQKVNLNVENTFPGGNIIALSVDDGYVVHWETEGIDSFKNKDTIRLRSTGEKEIICNIATKGGTVSISRTVEVTSVPDLVPEPLAFLVDYFGDGRTWVYASDYDDGTLHWYLSAPYDWQELWWAPLADGVSPEDGGLEDELFFEKIDDKYYLTVTSSPGEEPVTGEFFFDEEQMLLTLDGVEIPDGDHIYKNVFEVKVLNENELVLFQDEAGAAQNSGWVWRFKRKGYKYP
ncbi:hypothetical protein [Anaerophaga thermohalophila]|jgi:hypothetical protein|uniref:hypothetical protein n=1 Tax=Anaerophaga thermohalophila TaxID=177400 RepID=UPI0002F602F2|nr:hypothetical protein [Anaerophaga thermohalophila]